jgi:hypothetical protein
MGEVLRVEFGQAAQSELALAAGAECLASQSLEAPLVGLADVLPMFPERPLSEVVCFSTESIPELDSVRHQARAEAHRILEVRRESLFAGDFEAVPLEIDVLGTVAKAEAVKVVFGEHSDEYKEVRSGGLLDYMRKVAEGEAEQYFEPTVQVLDRATDKLFADGLCVDEMLANGLTPLSNPEEEAYRINDFVLQAEKKAILLNPTLAGRASIHTATCAQWAIDAYQQDQKSAHGNYRPADETLMFEYDWFDYEAGETYHEQVALPGDFITDEVVTSVYIEAGLLPQGTNTDKGVIHQTHGLVERSEVSDVFGFVKLLDAEASRQSGKTIFMGKEVSDDHPRDYQAVRDEAQDRRAKQQETAEQMLEYAEELYRNDTDAALAAILVEKKLKDLLLAKAETDHELAARAFDDATADGFARAQALKAAGRHTEAAHIIEQTRMQAPAVASCGAGSCGLESLSPSSIRDTEAKQKLQLKPGESVVKDTERSCKGCGEKSIYYAWTSGHVKKLCMGCGYSNFTAKPSKEEKPKSFSMFSSSDKKVYTLVA